ncbi:MAG: MoxR family ATPase [Leptospiraceae bacterium]|nr:MoxR family ATPase [Leptospiraceae bacterium]
MVSVAEANQGGSSAGHFQGSSSYYLSPELERITRMAMVLNKPLLLTGEPGTGKTQLAFEIARSLQMPIEALRCKSTIRGEETCYVQDTVLRLNDARFGSGDTGRDVNSFHDYIIWGPIGRAFQHTERVVLLLDEIDKTESDVQDNLLDVLEDNQFTIREINETVKARQAPVIIITSNAKRELSDPFLRRCFCHHIAFPDSKEMEHIISLHFPDLDQELKAVALRLFYDLRQRGYEKPPATSELLNWLAAIGVDAISKTELESGLPFPGILIKRASDLEAYRNQA